MEVSDMRWLSTHLWESEEGATLQILVNRDDNTVELIIRGSREDASARRITLPLGEWNRLKELV